MSGDDRLPAGLEAAALRRQVEAQGGSATILRKGDEQRGVLLLLIASRGRHIGCYERSTAMDGQSRWGRTGPGEEASSSEIQEFLTKRAKFDGDLWAIELDIPQPQRFIAELEPLS